nr:MAG TPA: hypothetical protein [Ackermannviridae sp.]
MADTIKISELTEYTAEVTDSLLIPLDDGTKTYKVSVGHFNQGAAASAKAYADKAASSAKNAADSEANTKQVSQEITTNTSAAKDAAKEAEDAKNATVQLKADTERAVASIKASVDNASSSALSAADSADDATESSTLSKSWAIGGTGKREDEDVNNAKYWASIAGAAAGGGVLSFNGRSGFVVPADGDYKSEQIKRGDSNVEVSLTALEETAGDATNVPIGTVVEATEEYPEIFSGETAGVISGKAKKFLASLKLLVENVDKDLRRLISNADDKISNVDKKTSVRLPTQSLTASGGTLTFTDTSITETALIDVYATIPNISPSSYSVSGTALTVVFDAQERAFDVCVTVRKS